MPRRSLTPCAQPGCPELSRRSRCDHHHRQQQRDHDRTRPTRTQRGLDNQWLKLRDRLVADHLNRHGPTCPGYQRPPHTVTADQLTGDHIIPRKIAPERRLDPTNIQILCVSCNSSKRNKPAEE